MTHHPLHEGLDVVELPVAALVLDVVRLELVVLQEGLQQLGRVHAVLEEEEEEEEEGAQDRSRKAEDG